MQFIQSNQWPPKTVPEKPSVITDSLDGNETFRLTRRRGSPPEAAILSILQRAQKDAPGSMQIEK
jgi:hypothetical protein